MSGKQTRYVQVPREVLINFGMKEVVNMFDWFEQYGYYGPGADLKEFKALYPQAKTFEQWVKDSKFLQ